MPGRANVPDTFITGCLP